MILIIVESYTKSKKIQSFLGNAYKVIASIGHFMDLPKNELGVNTETWTCSYVVTKPDVLKNIKTNCKLPSLQKVLIASDKDREGEAIGYHIQEVVKRELPNITIERMTFNEITKNAILTSINNTTNINMRTVKAQETRRILDRLAGYKLSPILWSVFNNNRLSCGRVQSVVLEYIVLRLEEMQTFMNENTSNVTWNIIGDFEGYKGATYMESEKQPYEYVNEQELVKTLKSFTKTPYHVTRTHQDKHTSPPPPYITTTIQIDCSSKLGIGTVACMSILQKLYESGYITYHRTDNHNVSKEFQRSCLEYIKKEYGEDYMCPRYCASGTTSVHECIRVTDVNLLTVSGDTNDKVYKLIWCRSVASQMSKCETRVFHYTLTCKQNIDIGLEHIFVSSMEGIIFEGFKRVYGITRDDMDKFEVKHDTSLLQGVHSVSKIKKARSLYSEADMIKKMEKDGIGRPSTYASTIKTLFARSYIQYGSNPKTTLSTHDYKLNLVTKKIEKSVTKHSLCDNVTSKRLLEPTEIGVKIARYMRENIVFITDKDFTRQMEQGLDKIEGAEITPRDVLEPFHTVIKTIHSSSTPSNTTSSTTTSPIIATLKTTKKNNALINTKYGWCIKTSSKKYVNIEGFLAQMNKSHDSLSDKEIDTIARLPKKIDNGATTVMIGRYGLYCTPRRKFTSQDFAKML